MHKILIVEDNEMNRDMLKRRLMKKGFSVVATAEGKASVIMAKEQNPDLILMDISLPDIDGVEAMQQIKANPETQKIPIVALTAHAMGGDREKFLGLGFDEYDTKPVEFGRLVIKIIEILES